MTTSIRCFVILWCVGSLVVIRQYSPGKIKASIQHTALFIHNSNTLGSLPSASRSSMMADSSRDSVNFILKIYRDIIARRLRASLQARVSILRASVLERNPDTSPR